MPYAPRTASAFWVARPFVGELRTVELAEPGPTDVLVRTRWSGISRGTESLVFRGAVPVDQREAMRSPFQEGNFPGPVKYGYLAVGEVESGPADLLGRTVFCLHPHQDRFVVPADAVLPVPNGIPPRRAVLAGAVETAVNALWDAAPLLGDRITVVGAGMVGCCVSRLAAGIPGVVVTMVDVDPSRADIAARIGARFATPDAAPRGQDLVFHCSASAAGLQLSLELLVAEGTVIELSWYGDQPVSVRLGSSFHSGRLAIRSSQVGKVSTARRASRTSRDRLALALELLADPSFDALLSGSSRFADLPETMGAITDGRLPALCHTIEYED